MVFALVVLSMPSAASAGIFSFVSDLFSGKEEVSSAAVVTSQNISLLQAALNPDPNPAKGGGDITVVGDTALLPESGPSLGTMDTYSRSDQISLYVVREGDTLSEIAKMFDVSVNTIMWANNVTPKTLRPGDKLVILPISGVQYTVAKGDTLKSIAAKYKADAGEIIQFNDLESGAPLAIGTIIIIPDGEIAAPKSSQSPGVIRGTGGPSYAGYYAKPILSYVKTQGLHGYNGVDMGAPAGTPIVAAATGDVIVSKSSGWNGGYGIYVVISHPNETQTLYSHMSESVAYVGMHVVKGQVIGYVGSTGKSTGPHLHFEVRGAKNPF
jgi:LysM repeat protein